MCRFDLQGLKISEAQKFGHFKPKCVFLVVCTTLDLSSGVQSWPKTMHWKDLSNTDKMTTISCKMDKYYNISDHFNFGPKMADPCGAWLQKLFSEGFAARSPRQPEYLQLPCCLMENRHS
jgi:hypothetical protein